MWNCTAVKLNKLIGSYLPRPKGLGKLERFPSIFNDLVSSFFGLCHLKYLRCLDVTRG